MARFWRARRLRMVIVTRIDVTVTMSSTIEDTSIIVILHRRYIAKKNEGKGLLQDPLYTRSVYLVSVTFWKDIALPINGEFAELH